MPGSFDNLQQGGGTSGAAPKATGTFANLQPRAKALAPAAAAPQPTFQNQNPGVDITPGGGGVMGYSAGRGGGTPFDFHVVTPQFAVKNEDQSFSAFGKKTFNSISSLAGNLFNSMTDLFDFVGSNKPTAANAVAATAMAGSSVAQTAFSGISQEMSAAANLPSANLPEKLGFGAIKYPAEGANWVFGKLGEGGAWLFGKGVDALPVSDQTKNILRQPISDLGATVVPLLAAEGVRAGVGGLTNDQTVVALRNESGMPMVNDNGEVQTETKTAPKPGIVPKVIRGASAAANFSMAPFSTLAEGISSKIQTKMQAAADKGKNVDDPQVAKQVVSEAVKETPTEVKTPDTMVIHRTDENGALTGEKISIGTDQSLVLKNMIKGQEDLNYKVIRSLGKDTSGNPIDGRFEWNYKTQKGTVYVTRSTTADSLAHEFGHYLDHTLAGKVGEKMSDMLPDYNVNSTAINGALAGWSIDRMMNSPENFAQGMTGVRDPIAEQREIERLVADGMPRSQAEEQVKQEEASGENINASISELADNFQSDIKALSDRKSGEGFASAVARVIQDAEGSAKIAPDFTSFIKYSLEDRGLRKAIESAGVKEKVEIPAKNNDIEQYVASKGTKFRLAAEDEKNYSDLTTKILDRIGDRDTISAQFIKDLTNSPDIKRTERETILNTLKDFPEKGIDVKKFKEAVKADLLPLSVNAASDRFTRDEQGNPVGVVPRGTFKNQYEGVSLPDHERGDVAKYQEKIYESPIRTDAGRTHFSTSNSENYFGHTRVEDMADGKTRRVIEVQSDLFQKGNLENEKKPFGPGRNLDESRGTNDMEKRAQEVAQLEKYNDPTAHLRMVREEVAQAAKDGKKELQFPTGETAMKIEGLGNAENHWVNMENDGILENGDLRVGLQIGDGNHSWYVTDVLGDGKFKAVSEYTASELVESQGVSSPADTPWNKINPDDKETFDISGKMDEKNPIYKFYNDELSKYLKNKYGAYPITDKQGQTWMQVDVKPEMGTSPVEAFRTDTLDKKLGVQLTDQQKSELEKLNERIFGDNNLKIADQILTPEGQKALGAYKDGMIKILDGQADAKETFYHEAVHKYMDYILSRSEHVDLLTAARDQYGIKDLSQLEEKLSEDFINYAKSHEGVTGKIRLAFDTLISRAKSFFASSDRIQNFYQDILSEKGAQQQAKASESGVELKQGSTRIIRSETAPGEVVRPEVKPFSGKKLDTAAFNEEKVNAPRDVIDLIKKTAKENDNFGETRRSATLEEMKDFSRRYLGDQNLYKSLPSDIRGNIGNLKAAQQTMVDLATDLSTDLKGFDPEHASEAEMQAMKEKLVRLEQVTQTFSGARTEVSHLFASLKAEVTPGENNVLMNLFKGLKDAGMDTSNLDEFFEKKNEILHETRGQALMNVWYSFLLSGPSTFMKKALSETGSTLGEISATLFRNPKELATTLPALINGLKDGMGIAKDVVSGKRELDNPGFTSRQEKIPYEFQGVFSWMNKVRVVGRLLSATSAIFGEGQKQMELAGLKGDMPTPSEILKLAKQKAKAEGLRGQTQIDAAKEYAKTPEVLLGDLADKFALKGTFRGTPTGILGALSRALTLATTERPAIKFIEPFSRVVANVLNRAIDYTPYGFTRGKTEEGIIGRFLATDKVTERTQREFKQQMGRAISGTILMAGAYALAQQGVITGSGPGNVNHKNELMDTGWMPNSIKVGNHYFPYMGLGPLALPLAIVGNIADAERYGKTDQQDLATRALSGIAGASETIFNESFLSGLASVMKIAQSGDPKQFLNYLTRSATGLVEPNLIKQVGNLFDNKLYDKSTIGASILANLHVAGAFGEKPSLDVFGEPIHSEFISGITPTTASEDPVRKFLASNNLWVSIPAKTTQLKLGAAKDDKRPMTSDEYYEYVQRSGPLIKKTIQQDMPQILNLKTVDDQQAFIDNKIVTPIRDKIKVQIQNEAKQNK